MILTICTQKGGCGKTTLSYEIVQAMARYHGKRVLCVDLDIQCNLTQTVSGYKTHDITLADVVCGADVKSAVCAADHVSYLPGSAQICDLMPDSMISILAPVKSDYDIIIIDTPPELSTPTISALAASDYYLIVATPSAYSLTGIVDILRTATAIQHGGGNVRPINPGLRCAGLVLNKANKRTQATKAVLPSFAEATQQYGIKLFGTAIRQSTAIEAAQMQAASVFDVAGKTAVADDLRALAAEIAKEVI